MNDQEQPPKELSEKNFIHDDLQKDPSPAWIWLAVIAIVSALLWGIGSASREEINGEVQSSPFLQVTNRQMSVFLWQFPELMRANVSSKTAYLPGFQYLSKLNIEPGMADQYVSAPPQLLFLYHTWSRLIKNEWSRRIIRPSEFQEFLKYATEWDPKEWKDAPKEYIEMISTLPGTKLTDLQSLAESTLPNDVRLAFIGWKNFMKEGTKINEILPSVNEMQLFLKEHAHYARNYWGNIVLDSAPKYLMMLQQGKSSGQEIIPTEELAPFLRVGFFNFEQSKKEYGRANERSDMNVQFE